MASNDDFEFKESYINNYWAKFIREQSKSPPKEDDRRYHFRSGVANNTSGPIYDDSTKLDVADIAVFGFAPADEPPLLVMCLLCERVTLLRNMESHITGLHKCSIEEYSIKISQIESAYGSEKSNSCPSNRTLSGKRPNRFQVNSRAKKSQRGRQQLPNCVVSEPTSSFVPENKSQPSMSQLAVFLVQTSTLPTPPVQSNNSLLQCTNSIEGAHSLSTYSKRKPKNSTVGGRGRGRKNNNVLNNCVPEESVHLPIDGHSTFCVETASTTVPLISGTYSKSRMGTQKNSAPSAGRSKKRKCDELCSNEYVQDNVHLSNNEQQMPAGGLVCSVPMAAPHINNLKTFSKSRRGSYRNSSSGRGRRGKPNAVLNSVPGTSVHLINSEHWMDNAVSMATPLINNKEMYSTNTHSFSSSSVRGRKGRNNKIPFNNFVLGKKNMPLTNRESLYSVECAIPKVTQEEQSSLSPPLVECTEPKPAEPPVLPESSIPLAKMIQSEIDTITNSKKDPSTLGRGGKKELGGDLSNNCVLKEASKYVPEESLYLPEPLTNCSELSSDLQIIAKRTRQTNSAPTSKKGRLAKILHNDHVLNEKILPSDCVLEEKVHPRRNILKKIVPASDGVPAENSVHSHIREHHPTHSTVPTTLILNDDFESEKQSLENPPLDNEDGIPPEESEHYTECTASMATILNSHLAMHSRSGEESQENLTTKVKKRKLREILPDASVPEESSVHLSRNKLLTNSTEFVALTSLPPKGSPESPKSRFSPDSPKDNLSSGRTKECWSPCSSDGRLSPAPAEGEPKPAEPPVLPESSSHQELQGLVPFLVKGDKLPIKSPSHDSQERTISLVSAVSESTLDEDEDSVELDYSSTSGTTITSSSDDDDEEDSSSSDYDDGGGGGYEYDELKASTQSRFFLGRPFLGVKKGSSTYSQCSSCPPVGNSSSSSSEDSSRSTMLTSNDRNLSLPNYPSSLWNSGKAIGSRLRSRFVRALGKIAASKKDENQDVKMGKFGSGESMEGKAVNEEKMEDEQEKIEDGDVVVDGKEKKDKSKSSSEDLEELNRADDAVQVVPPSLMESSEQHAVVKVVEHIAMEPEEQDAARKLVEPTTVDSGKQDDVLKGMEFGEQDAAVKVVEISAMEPGEQNDAIDVLEHSTQESGEQDAARKVIEPSAVESGEQDDVLKVMESGEQDAAVKVLEHSTQESGEQDSAIKIVEHSSKESVEPIEEKCPATSHLKSQNAQTLSPVAPVRKALNAVAHSHHASSNLRCLQEAPSEDNCEILFIMERLAAQGVHLDPRTLSILKQLPSRMRAYLINQLKKCIVHNNSPVKKANRKNAVCLRRVARVQDAIRTFQSLCTKASVLKCKSTQGIEAYSSVNAPVHSKEPLASSAARMDITTRMNILFPSRATTVKTPLPLSATDTKAPSPLSSTSTKASLRLSTSTPVTVNSNARSMKVVCSSITSISRPAPSSTVKMQVPLPSARKERLSKEKLMKKQKLKEAILRKIKHRSHARLDGTSGRI